MIALLVATAAVVYVWKAQTLAFDHQLEKLANSKGLVYSRATLAPRDVNVFGACVLILAASEIEGWRYLLPLAVAAWLASLTFRRIGTDPRILTVFGMQLIWLAFCWFLDMSTALWWSIVLFGCLVAVVRRLGVPTCPILFAHMLPCPAKAWQERLDREAWTGRPGQGWSELPVTTPDGIELFALKYELPGVKRWTVFFNGNAMLTQNSLDGHQQFAEEMECNLVSFNYRGCGGSTGTPRTGEDLVSDGQSVLEQVVAYSGVPADKVLFFSIGFLNLNPRIQALMLTLTQGASISRQPTSLTSPNALNPTILRPSLALTPPVTL